MAFDRRLANTRAPVVCGVCCPSSQNLIKKALHEITANVISYSRLAKPFFSSCWFLSNASTAHHNITWHLGTDDEHFAGAAISGGRVSASQLKGWVLDPRPLSESLWRFLGKIVRLNCPGEKHISGVGMPLIAVAKMIKKNYWHISCYFLMFSEIFSINAISCSPVIRWAYQG